MQYIKVTVDTNDADYEDREELITDEQLKKIMPVIEAIRHFKPYKGEWSPGKFMTYNHNYPSGECCRTDMGEKTVKQIYSHIDPELIDFFEEEYCPWAEYGFHDIESIQVYEECTCKRQIKDLLRCSK